MKWRFCAGLKAKKNYLLSRFAILKSRKQSVSILMKSKPSKQQNNQVNKQFTRWIDASGIYHQA